MNDIGTMVSELIAAGCAPEVAARVVAQAFVSGVSSADVRVTSRDESATSRREKDRIRQQNRRDNLRTSADDRDNLRTSRDGPLSKSSLEEKREAEPDVSRVTTWTPPEADWQDAVAKLGEQTATSELAKFREINRRAGARRESDWRVWVIRSVDFLAKSKPPPASAPAADQPIDWEPIVRTWTKTGYWSHQAGPDPESPACRCPRDLIEKISAEVRQ